MDDKACNYALDLSTKAVYYEQSRKYEEAIFCYIESAEQLLKLVQEKKCLPILRKKVEEFIDRAQFLKNNLENFQKMYPKINENVLEDVEFLMLKASIYQKSSKKRNEAKELFEKVVETCLKSAKNPNLSGEIRAKLRKFAEEALENAETFSEPLQKNEEFDLVLPDVPLNSQFASISTSDSPPPPTPSVSRADTSKVLGQRYTKEELNVLSTTSNINNKLYVPFHSYDKINEFRGQNGKFTDKDGKIGLTEKQRNRIRQWKRASDLFENPILIASIDSAAIKQTIISDCSFVSSLTVAALYEKKFRKQLVTSIIFPQDSSGKPVFNPLGKYLIKFHLNGCWRKVVIDDYFPVNENDQMMCSQNEKKGELWVALLEKAYMKVMGGYDFPGSNSNIDLNALTGWIPERISIKKDSKEFDADKVFRKLFDRMHRGDCLITLATGRLSKDDCDRAGLVETHAYAVLDIRCVDNQRILKVKNPWTHLRWKGNFSDRDKLNWTEKMKKSLNYDPEKAAEKDDGIFWIDYESVIHFFDVFYVNWNPELFAFTSVYHASWNQCAGPVKDLYTVGDNPQYSLVVNGGKTAAAVWILLTRHITRIDDFAENKEYITVIVYESDKKIYIPSDPKPISDGVRINSPHYLCQLVTKPGINKYSLVVAQYEKTTTIHYSLRVYSTAEISLKPITVPYKITKTIRGNWEASQEPEKRYPIIKLTIQSSKDDVAILLELKAPKQFSVAIELKQFSSERTIFYETKNTGPYRPGYTVLAVENVPAGIYYAKLATYTPGQKGPFILKVDSTSKIELEQLKF